MSITAESMTPADIAACTGGCGNDGWGGGWSSWIILFLIFGLFGFGGYGFGGGMGGGAAQNYVLNSDFATIQRQLSDGFNGLDNAMDRQNSGICDLGYTQLSLSNQTNTNMMQGFNAVQTQLADCCCKTQQNIKDVQYGIATASGDIKYAIKDCCCENEKIAMQNRFDNAQNTCGILQAIDKSADRVIDFLCNERTQALRDENQALRLAASQQAQNAYLVSKLSPPQPVPSYPVPNPFYYGGNCGGCNC